MPNTRFIPLLLAAITACAATAYGRLVAMSREFPAADAITHVESWIKSHPNDATGYIVLARIHALAWAYGDKIPLVSDGTTNPLFPDGTHDSLPTFSEFSTVLVSRSGPSEALFNGAGIVDNSDRKDRPITAADAAHLAASIAAYRKALELKPTAGLSELGLAWMLAQQGVYVRDLPADYFATANPTDAEKQSWTQTLTQLADPDPLVRDAASKTLLAAMPHCVLFLRDIKPTNPESEARIQNVLQGYFELQALDHYRKAFTLQKEVDLKTDPTYQVDTQISARAGTQILTLLAKHPDAAQKNESKTVQDVLDPLAVKMQHLMMMPQ